MTHSHAANGPIDAIGAGIARSKKARFRKPILLLAVAPVLALALVANYLPKDSSQAATSSVYGVTWDPGLVNYSVDDSGCHTWQAARITAESKQAADNIFGVLDSDKVKDDYPAESMKLIKMIQITSIQQNGNTIDLQMDGWASNQECGQASSSHSDSIRAAAQPAWTKGAVAAIVGAAVYVAVSSLVTAAITAVGVEVGATALTIAALTAVAGCIGGAASMAVTLLMAGAGNGWKENLANAIAGCMTGAVIALLPIKQVGAYAGNALRTALGFGPTAVAGETIVQPAAEAAVELSPVSSVIISSVEHLLAR